MFYILITKRHVLMSHSDNQKECLLSLFKIWQDCIILPRPLHQYYSFITKFHALTLLFRESLRGGGGGGGVFTKPFAFAECLWQCHRSSPTIFMQFIKPFFHDLHSRNKAPCTDVLTSHSENPYFGCLVFTVTY